jgi:DNA adenine methylase
MDSLKMEALKEVNPVQPFLKWAGGKRWIGNLLVEILGNGNGKGKFIEPFIGGGACFFLSKSKKAILSDLNEELIDCYKAVRDHPDAIIRKLNNIPINKKTFLEIRSKTPTNKIQLAVRFIYLNRTAFNGLYRVNKNGDFNVPFGCKPTTKFHPPEIIKNCSQRLLKAKIISSDFESTLSKARTGDRIYLDPPYTVKHNNNGFRRYNERIFTWFDQRRLANRVQELAKKDCRLVMTNALHHEIVKLYSSKYFKAFSIFRNSNMAASSSKRGPCQELLIISKSTDLNKANLNYLFEKYLPGKVEKINLPIRNE